MPPVASGYFNSIIPIPWRVTIHNSTAFLFQPNCTSRSAAVPFKAFSEIQPKSVPALPATTPQREIDGDTYRFTPHLKILNADRYRVYPSLSPTIRISFCWAHQRRDFIDFQTAYPQPREGCQWADQWIQRIANLYHLNQQRLAVLADPPAFALAQTQLEQAIAQIDLLVAQRTALPAPQRKILDSMQAHWSGLIIFVEDPAIPMDNNQAERLIRTPVVGRKNFAGHQTQQAGKLGAILYSIVLTCQLHDFSPFVFLCDYFNACAKQGAPPSDFTPFSPWLFHPPASGDLPPLPLPPPKPPP